MTIFSFMIYEEIFAGELVKPPNGDPKEYFITGRGCGGSSPIRYLNYIPDDLSNHECTFISLNNNSSPILKCFVTGNYVGNDIDIMPNINDATSCQEECEKLAECKFWTYNSYKKKCWRHTAKAPEILGTCKNCTRGPRICANGK